MNLQSVPVVGRVFDMGADDQLFDALLLAGPILVLVIVFAGRQGWTVGLVSAYILVFILEICANFIWGTKSRSSTFDSR